MMTDESLFYLAFKIARPIPGLKWFKCSPLGANSLTSMLQNMIKASGLETDKNLVNHSTRKPNEIIQITRHKNVNSFNNYSMLPYFRTLELCDSVFRCKSETNPNDTFERLID